MTDQPVNLEAAKAATALQRQAARPDHSVFVSANAGTGKTQVLTMRVLRLLLSGAPADTILCLTYTKAAAAEMRHRLNKELSKWAICDESALLKALEKLGIERPTQAQIDTARSLFAHILDHEDGPLIETVHSFCQSVLQRFPIESGIAPQFDLISDHDRNMLLTECFYAALQDASAVPATREAKAFRSLAAQSDDEEILKRLKGFLGNRTHAHKMAHDLAARQDFEKQLFEDAGLFDPADIAGLTAQTLDSLATQPLKEIADMLARGGINQQKRAVKIQNWLALDPGRQPAELGMLARAFLTDEGQPQKRLSDKQIDADFPDSVEMQMPTLQLLSGYQTSIANALCFELTMALTDAGSALYRRFQQEKTARGVLDYDDLIFFTSQLLGQEEQMAWVRWKLDRGINHLLVDEAQDTSPDQWALIRYLSTPFFEDVSDIPMDGSHAETRSFFAVGDFKQSIYSFQGARPQTFAASREYFQDRLEQVNRPFSEIDFTLSFRSSGAVLEFVNTLFKRDTHPGLGAVSAKPHDVYHTHLAGLVELWPVIESAPAAPPPYLDLPQLSEGDDGPVQQARRVAGHIKSLLDGAHHEHFGAAIAPQDILILLRKRDSFFALLRAELERAGIPVAGADRMALKNQIEILDLLALADVCLLPEDDLQLACVLKSPLVGLPEEALLELASSRKDKSLFDQLMRFDGSADRFGAAIKKLLDWRQLSQNLPVFEFFSTVLSQGGRQAFHRRLGHAVDESLDAFLLRARDHGQNAQPGLSHFLHAFRQGNSEVKRDMDTAGANEVRVMTIHGAKGLEAPIVYLPDMLTGRTPSDSLVMTEEAVYWPAGKPESAYMAELKNQAKEIREEESDRLLYVALTRARQALFISGWSRKNSRVEKDSWYASLLATIKECSGAIELADGGWLLRSGVPEHRPKQALATVASLMEIPDWYEEIPKNEPIPARPLTPSDPGVRDQTIPFGTASRKEALLRGQFVHRLLETLPDLPVADRWAATSRIADNMGLERADSDSPAAFTAAQIKVLFEQVEAVMDLAELAPLFGKGVLAEADITGLVGGLTVQGKIDRMAVLEDKIIIADFKTGLPPDSVPDSTSDASPEIPAAYLRQMALYGALVEQIYPDKVIECLLIWTQSLQVTNVPASARKKTLDLLLEGQAHS